MFVRSRVIAPWLVLATFACHSPEPTRSEAPRTPTPVAPAPPPAPPVPPPTPSPTPSAPPSVPRALPSALPTPAQTTGEAAGITYVERVNGSADPDARLPLVIAMHGLGDTPDAFVHVIDGLDVPARVVSLRGLDAWGEGWSWFQPGLDPESPAYARALERSARRVAAAIAEIARARPTCGRLVVLGFSQGAMLTDTLAARETSLHALYLPIAGRLAAATEIVPGPRDISVHALHGRADPRVPIASAETAHARFARARIPSQLESYPDTGHTVSLAMRRELLQLIHDADAGGCATP